jgi:hypothetical protein
MTYPLFCLGSKPIVDLRREGIQLHLKNRGAALLFPFTFATLKKDGSQTDQTVIVDEIEQSVQILSPHVKGDLGGFSTISIHRLPLACLFY